MIPLFFWLASVPAIKISSSLLLLLLLSSSSLQLIAMSFYSQEPHFLEACHLCQKPLGYNSDIFMYRGNTPFCSKECRQEQIEMDESPRKKTWKSSSSWSSSSRSIRNSDSKESSNNSARKDTVAVA